MKHVTLGLFLALMFGLMPAAVNDAAILNPELKKAHPPHPEEGGLRLEVNATLDDILMSDGKAWAWDGAFLRIEIALHNVSSAPITVPTLYYEGSPRIISWPGWGESTQRILIAIEPPTFQGKATVFNAARFCPVTLAPGDFVLLLDHKESIKERKHADAIKEASVHFGVSSRFTTPTQWWKGHLETYAPIQRRTDPDKEIERLIAAQVRYNAEKAAERSPGYGKSNATRVAAMIADCDHAEISNEGAKWDTPLVVKDTGWIKQVGAVVATGSLPVAGSCLCTGWRTVSFFKDTQRIVSLAAIHGHQLRIFWLEGGGDYEVDEAYWNRVQQALAYSDRPSPFPVLVPTLPASPPVTESQSPTR